MKWKFKFILFDKVNIHNINQTPLHLAVIKNNIDIIKLLLSNPKVDTHIKDCVINKCFRIFIIYHL